MEFARPGEEPFAYDSDNRLFWLRVRDAAAVVGGLTARDFDRRPGEPWGNLSPTRERDPAVAERRRRTLLALLGDELRLAAPRLTHGADAWILEAQEGSCRSALVREDGGEEALAPEVVPEADIAVTDCPGVVLFMTYADCLPLYVYAPGRAIALAHAGWRGTVRNVAGRAVELLVRAFGADPGTLRAVVGPGISRASYEVGEDVLRALESLRERAGLADTEIERVLDRRPVRRVIHGKRPRRRMARRTTFADIREVGGHAAPFPRRGRPTRDSHATEARRRRHG
ncbi:MAG: polyphenol oxidase family protein [Brockia lithotrophica]|nr:polyphenol oxidase family protein [Brockia lithotrophica]